MRGRVVVNKKTRIQMDRVTRMGYQEKLPIYIYVFIPIISQRKSPEYRYGDRLKPLIELFRGHF